MIRWLEGHSLPVRVLAYTGALILVLALAVGAGALGALLVRNEPVVTGGRAPQAGDRENPPGGQGGATTVGREGTEEGTDSQRAEAAVGRDEEARYAEAVGEIQEEAVGVFRSSHERLLRYDSLTAGDVEAMRNNQASLEELTVRTAALDPPGEYDEQYEVFVSAIGELHETARLAYDLAAEPTAAVPGAFAEYDSLVNEAAAGLRRSNELLGRDHETVGDPQDVDTL